MTEITISKKQLLDCLLRLRKGFGVKVAIPILNDYKFEIEGSKMSVSVLGEETWMTESFTLPDKSVASEGEPRRAWCVNRHYLIPALRSLEDQDITLKVYDYQMSVNHSSGSFAMPIDDSNEYPAFDFGFTDKNGNDRSTHLKLEAPGVRHWLYMLYTALAVDFLRPVMNGMVFNLSPEGLELCASDGHKLVRIRKQSVCGDKKNIIIPRKAINVLSDVLPRTGDIGFTFTQEESHEEDRIHKDEVRKVTVVDVVPTGRIDIDTEHTLQLWFRGIDGRYPNYNSVIPPSYPYSISVDRRRLTKCLERAKVFSNDSSFLVKLDIQHDRIGLNAEDMDFQLFSQDSIPCESRCGNFSRQTIGLKITSVLDLIKRLATNTILLNFADPSRAMIIEPEPQPEVEDVTMLIMPMIY